MGNDIADNTYPPDTPASRAYRGALVTPVVAERSRVPVLDLWYRGRLWFSSLWLSSAMDEVSVRLAAHAFPRAGAAAPTAHAADFERGWPETQTALAAFAELCREQRTPLLVLVVPSKEDVDARGALSQAAEQRLTVVNFLRAHGVHTLDVTPWLRAA